jgi:hypothetical protein
MPTTTIYIKVSPVIWFSEALLIVDIKEVLIIATLLETLHTDDKFSANFMFESNLGA